LKASKLFKYLFLASTLLIAACPWYNILEENNSPDRSIRITNNSEYNITRVIIINTEATKTESIVVDEKDNELIAKNGSSKTFNIGSAGPPWKPIACVEAEDTLEPICTLYLNNSNITWNITWNGNDSPDWLPATSFYECSNLFAFVQCRPEVKDE